jgi:hypothetical protein
VNAAAFALLGVDLISQPPLAATVLQRCSFSSCCVRAACRHSGGLAAAALTFVQFLNPTANWYALFVAVLAIIALAWPSRSVARLLLVGFLLGALFLFRQLTGVLFAMGALTYLLYEAHAARVNAARRSRRRHRRNDTRAAGYLIAKVELFAARSMASGSLTWPGRSPSGPPDRAVVRLMGWLLAGSLLAAVPLLIYRRARALADWLRDSFVTANRITGFEFISTPGTDLLARCGGRPAAVNAVGRERAVLDVPGRIAGGRRS